MMGVDYAQAERFGAFLFRAAVFVVAVGGTAAFSGLGPAALVAGGWFLHAAVTP